MEINEIDDDDLLNDDFPQQEEESSPVWKTAEEVEQEENNEEENNINNENSFDTIAEFLKDNGIEDLNKIKFQGEDGEVVERAWKDLNNQEQLNILRSNVRTEENPLDDEEVEFINGLRSQGISPTQYLQLLNQQFEQQLSQVQSQQPEPEIYYSSDQLSDDELFILDLKNRIKDISDDELASALANAKMNEDFYKKNVDGIRAEYQRLEQEKIEQDQAIALQEQQERYAEYSNSILGEINNLSNIGDLDITMNTDEMNELADFMLGFDEQGQNYFNRALQDPQTSVQMAWFALHGEELLNGISDYYNKEIQRARKEGFAQGKASVKQPQQKPQVAYVPNNNKQSKFYKTIEDLDD